MPEANTDQRHAPYASLRSAPEPEADKARGASPASDTDYLAAEADKLESFKKALYAAFLAAPTTGIPTALVDLSATYISALRLQMSLKGLSAVSTKPAKAPMFNAGRGK
jgi:hypothetical protein